MRSSGRGQNRQCLLSKTWGDRHTEIQWQVVVGAVAAEREQENPLELESWKPTLRLTFEWKSQPQEKLGHADIWTEVLQWRGLAHAKAQETDVGLGTSRHMAGVETPMCCRTESGAERSHGLTGVFEVSFGL